MGANVQDIDSITLGSGILYIDPDENGSWVNIGQLLNDVTFEYTVELLKLEAGTPRVLITQAKAAEGATLSGEVAELTATNLQTALGISDTYVDTTEGTETSVTDEAISFSGADDVYHIGHSNVSAVTITSAEGGTGDTYIEGTDYFLNATEGTITAITGGTATMPVDGTTLYLNYTYTPIAKKTINFGGGSGGLPTMGLKFVHTKPDTNTITIVLHKVQTAGSATFTFSDGAWNSIPLTFDAVADSTKDSGSQLGYLEITTA
jgi:hypothetical protein